MGHKIDLTKDINELKAIMEKEFQEMYKQGYAAGTVSTCGILYKTFQIVGLEETNVLFTILKDLASKNGCPDLDEYAKKMKA